MTQGTVETDVVIVGAGLAGLQCARVLREHGVPSVVLEAGDAVGGRVRTDLVDGFRCDRGFQLLNPAYPAVRRHVDVDALDLRVFGRGVSVTTARGQVVAADPLRHPGLLGETLRSGYLRPAELARLARWLAPALGSVPRLERSSDTTLTRSLDAARVTGRLRHEVLMPFLAGVLAEDGGTTSASFVRLLMRSFVRATPGVPAGGMQALSDQLAHGLDVRLQTPADRLVTGPDGPGVTTDDGTIRARAVVVATEPSAAAHLLAPHAALTAPAMKGLVTWWFAPDAGQSVDEVGPHPDFLHVDGRGSQAGPVLNAAVMTTVAPSYAPPGRHLVAATTLASAAAAESDVRRQVAEMLGVPTDRWEVVIRHDIHHALPAQPPPLDVRRPVDLGGGLLVAGDHRDTASIQGAMVSGARAAHAVLRAR